MFGRDRESNMTELPQLVQGLDQIWLGIICFNTGWQNGGTILLVLNVLNILYGVPQARFFSV